MENPFDKDWTKPEEQELYEGDDSAYEERQDPRQLSGLKKTFEGMADAIKDIDIPIMAHWLPGRHSGIVSGYEHFRNHQNDIAAENTPPTMNYPTMEQEARMKKLRVTDREVFRCVAEKRGIKISNLEKGDGGSLKELRDEGLDILEQKLVQENIQRLVDSIQLMVEGRYDPSDIIVDGNHGWNEIQGRNYPKIEEENFPQPDLTIEKKE